MLFIDQHKLAMLISADQQESALGDRHSRVHWKQIATYANATNLIV